MRRSTTSPRNDSACRCIACWVSIQRHAPLSSFTIPITADDDALRRALDDAASYPVLKVKLGGPRDADTIAGVRAAAPDKILRVDANAAWTPKHALHMIDVLLDYDVELVEQPVAAHDIDGLRFVRERSPLPIIADESCLVATRRASARRRRRRHQHQAREVRRAARSDAASCATARAHDMSVMAGCMVETSLGISAAAHLAPLLDYADLDGAALLADDPFAGASIPDGSDHAARPRPGSALGTRECERRRRRLTCWPRSRSPLPLFNTFSYRVDGQLANAVVPGTRVVVPFRNRKEIGDLRRLHGADRRNAEVQVDSRGA